MEGSPQGALDRLAERCGVAFPHLVAARARTEAELAVRRERLARIAHDPDTAVVLMGSWGRRELTAGSDDDFIVLHRGAPRAGVRPAPADVEPVVGGGSARPGIEHVFGAVVHVAHLVGRIGRDADDNRNLTHRILLMLESVAVTGAAVHAAALDDVLHGYVHDQDEHDFRPPRFLLNDLVRYWRTICVDFVGKDRERGGHGWATRSVKLRLSRKVLFAGGLLPVLACHRVRSQAMVPFLGAQLAAPPVDRIADAFLHYAVPDAGLRTLGAYDRFIGRMHDPEARAALAALTRDEARRDPLFRELRRLGDDLQAGLLALLFETRDLAPLVREYGIF